MTKPPVDPSVHQEPHLRDENYHGDPSEQRAAETLSGNRRSEQEEVDQNVWSEPGISETLNGPMPDVELTYENWLRRGCENISWLRSWSTVLLFSLVAGPWAILGSFMSTGQSISGVLTLTVFGPVAEEVMKSALPLYTIEKRPFVFRSPLQILVCVAASGLAFAVIENLIYLNVYVPDAGAKLVEWRWTVCVGLHVTCAVIVGLGLVRVWRDVWRRMGRPRTKLIYPYMVTAIVLHGVYNGLATLLASVGMGF